MGNSLLNCWILLVQYLLFLGLFNTIDCLRIAVIGASSGVGQQVCARFVKENYEVIAIGRNRRKLESFPLLDECKKVVTPTTNTDELIRSLDGISSLVICVGTTAFPSKSWEGGKNNPQVACYESVMNIVAAIKKMRRKPSKILLISSIGVDRTDSFPFKILNLYGALGEKKRSENCLIESCKSLQITPIICRPGRLIGEPFTHFDLALLQVKQKDNKRGIRIEKSDKDILTGDVARKDAAESIFRILQADPQLLRKQYGSSVTYSIVNTEGESELTNQDWTLAMFS